MVAPPPTRVGGPMAGRYTLPSQTTHPVYSEDPDLQAALVEVSAGVDVQRLLRYQSLSP